MGSPEAGYSINCTEWHSSGATALELSVREGKPSLVDALLQKGAKHGRAMVIASEMGNVDLMKTFLAHDSNVQTAGGSRSHLLDSMATAIRGQHVQVVQVLGAEVIEVGAHSCTVCSTLAYFSLACCLLLFARRVDGLSVSFVICMPPLLPSLQLINDVLDKDGHNALSLPPLSVTRTFATNCCNSSRMGITSSHPPEAAWSPGLRSAATWWHSRR